MGLFDFFRTQEANLNRSSLEPNGENNAVSELEETVAFPSEGDQVSDKLNKEEAAPEYTNPEIPEDIFVEYKVPKRKTPMEPQETAVEINDLNKLYLYLEKNLEKKGYDDALTNPDTSYREEHIRYIQNELNLMVSKVKSYYNGRLRTVDLHIETRKRDGMIELVDELLTEKATLEDELKIVGSIESDSKNSNGLTENLFLSYKRGFRNGMAAITYNTVLIRKTNNP